MIDNRHGGGLRLRRRVVAPCSLPIDTAVRRRLVGFRIPGAVKAAPHMDFETYARSKQFDYAALAETVESILRAAIAAHPGAFHLQQVQRRAKNPESLKKKLDDRNLLSTTTLETNIKDLAGCRLIFYTNSDVSRFLQSGIIQDNFDVD